MKQTYLWMCLIGIMVWGGARAEDRVTADDLMVAVSAGDQAAVGRLFDQGMTQLAKMDSLTLVLMAQLALKDEDFNQADLLIQLALFRWQVDGEVFTPYLVKGDSPLSLIMVAINEIKMAMPRGQIKTGDEYRALIEAIEQWQPVCDRDYDPGFVYTGLVDYLACQSQLNDLIGVNLASMKERLPLYDHSEYFTLLQQYMQTDDGGLMALVGQQTAEQQALQDRLLAIEKALGVKGELTDLVELNREINLLHNRQ